jgi:hypothetical protein
LVALVDFLGGGVQRRFGRRSSRTPLSSGEMDQGTTIGSHRHHQDPAAGSCLMIQ